MNKEEGNKKRDNLDFGLLKVRQMKVKQVQAVTSDIKDHYKETTNFGDMSHEDLFKIVSGTDNLRKKELSKWYANKNGIYSRAVRYISDIYRFDYMLYPNLDLDDDLKEEKQKAIRKKFNSVLEHFDNSAIQLICRKWAQQVCLEGAYYGYICDDVDDKLVIQDLPSDYCRSRFLHRGLPLVEFNVRYFDKATNDIEFRKKLLAMFPEEIQIGYRKYDQGKLPAEDRGDNAGWILLDVNRAFKFNFLETDLPPFLSAIPSLIELEEIQDLQKEKLLQEIQKILIQQFKLDKNDQIPFSMKELQRLNQNALDMVGDSVGISVLSTVADVHLEDLSSDASKEGETPIQIAQTSAYNQFGISTNLFNTDGNLSLDKSIIIDEAFAKPLLLQFEQFFNRYLDFKFNKKELKFRMKMQMTTVFNYKEMSNTYKDLTKLGFSRFLPMIALGHTQKEVISLAKFEQQILQLDAYMLPPFSSNTMSSDTWSDIKALQEQILSGKNKITTPTAQTQQNSASKVANSVGEGTSQGGRPELPDDKKSDKTIANNASK